MDCPIHAVIFSESDVEDQISNYFNSGGTHEHLAVIEYDDFFKAEEVRLQFLKMQKEYSLTWRMPW